MEEETPLCPKCETSLDRNADQKYLTCPACGQQVNLDSQWAYLRGVDAFSEGQDIFMSQPLRKRRMVQFNKVEQEAVELLTTLSERSGARFEPDTVDFLLGWVGPHPQFLQVAGYIALELQNKGELSSDARSAVRKRTLEELEGHLEYYWRDLVGLRVVTDQGEMLGTLTEIIATGSNDVYVVQGREREYLIPALEEVVLEVNLDDGVMKVSPPEGLFDL